MKRVFPDREIVEVPKDHPVFSCFYKIDGYPAGRRPRLVPRRAARGRRAASSPHLRTILDDNGRPMMFINWNTDMGDGWEWSNAEEYPGYMKYTAHGVPDGDQRNRLRADALMASDHAWTSSAAAVSAERVAEGRERILAELRKVIVGQDEVVEQVLIALFTGGHCLITGVPGPGQDAADQDARRDPRPRRSSASSSRPT